jgi:serine/threonine protein kinase
MKMMEKFDSNEEDQSEAYVSPELSETAQNELRLMKQIKHENIIRYFDNFDEECYSTDYLCIICEYCAVLSTTLRLSFSIIILR